MLLEDRELLEQTGQIETLLQEIEGLPDPEVRARVVGIVQALLLLYGEGLARMLEVVRQQTDPAMAARLLQAFASDDLIAHLLLLHDLHPEDLETRVVRALDSVRPYLQSHGGNVEIVGIEGGIARLRLQGSCHGCPSSAATLKLAIEEALLKAAPDLEGIEAEGVARSSPAPNFVPASAILTRDDLMRRKDV